MKFESIDELARYIRNLHFVNGRKKKVVLCHGVFDLLHIGHIRHFRQAKEMGDILVVVVSPDEYVEKGPERPAFNHHLRAEAINALDCVDYVAIDEWPTAVETIKLIRPDIFAKGPDYKGASGQVDTDRQVIESIGGRIAFTDGEKFSSTKLLGKLVLPGDLRQYLSRFPYSVDDVLGYLRDIRLKVLVVGETIIDEYQYCEAMGTSAKEPILAVKQLYAEQFNGGILAVEKHLHSFCSDVGKVTSPPIIKRRFVESYLLQKLFEVYEFNQVVEQRDLCRKLDKVLPQYDVVIVVDYGHGMIGKEAVNILCEKSKFLAVNAQVNAGNKGFNTISKYPKADYVCLNRNELMLEARNQDDVRSLILNLAERQDYKKIMVTCGKDGSICYDGNFIEVPAFTQQVVDRLGAGDAVLALTALCVAQQAPMEIVGFIGNAVGAQAVQTVGNRTPIEQEPLFKFINNLISKEES